MSSSISALLLAIGPERVVDRAVAAIARQDVANIEIVVIHDRADEMSIRRSVETEIGRLPCTFVPAARLGPGGLRNLGVRSNSAPYFAIIDGSEELDPSYLGLARDALDATPGAGFAAAPVRHSLAAPLDSRVSSSTDLPRILASPWSIAGAALMRRASFDRVGGFDESLPDLVEWDYLLTLGEHGEHGVLLPRPLLARYAGDDVRLRQSLRAERHLPAVRRIVTRHRSSFEGHAARVLMDREQIAKTLWEKERALVQRRDRMRAELEGTMSELGRLQSELGAHHRSVLEWGDLKRTTPFSRNWGLDRGSPVDRYYIHSFVARHAADIHGTVLEVLDSDLTRRYGGDRVERSDVLDIDPGNRRASVIADLRNAQSIPSNTYDCFILTQTLHLLDDMPAAIRHAHRILKPGGVLLVTFPCASMVSSEYGSKGDHWRVTEAGARRLLGGAFADSTIDVRSRGNVLAITASLYGLAYEELGQTELESDDPEYPLIITVRAVKSADAVTPQRPSALPRGAAVLLYHRIASLDHDVHGLAVPPDTFRSQMEHLRNFWQPMRLADLAAAAMNGEPPDGAVAVTFDDGYVDNLRNAWPVLSEFGIPATLFLVGEKAAERYRFWWDVLESVLLQAPRLPSPLRIRVSGEPRSFTTSTPDERRASHDLLYAILKTSLPAIRDDIIRELADAAGLPLEGGDENRPMVEDEIRQFAALPGIDVGAHGLHHLSLPGLPRDHLYREIFESRTALERLVATSISGFAYPYGDVSTECVEMVRSADFTFAVTCESRPLRCHEDALRLPRLLAPPEGGTAFEAWLARAVGKADRAAR